MYLEDMAIEGFKSFSEKTDMSFQPGISVIIGNNGVGKSNILDAIIWGLGESDLNRIRCYSPNELFFAGSKDYPPATYIKVDMTFRPGPEKDAPKITLGRELQKDGRERYHILNQPYTLTEYRHNLAELNLTHALKTIIRQEQINDMLLLDPEKRFDQICALLDLQSVHEFSGKLENHISDNFRRYMTYLIPDATVHLEKLSQNGRKGIDIQVTLPGNRIRRAHQLSGGEKAITSLALKLAVFNQLHNPFYLLDEVEPSLDYVHHKSMQAFLKDVSKDTQLIMITHLRSTIELADTLHGVRTRWDGSSFMKFYFDMDERLLRLYKCC
ncbi:MAG: AAA family ATPase [Desulfatirhabdiaceae bacterium]